MRRMPSKAPSVAVTSLKANMYTTSEFAEMFTKTEIFKILLLLLAEVGWPVKVF
jgi:hypothetical protein